jgi:hypothetical protein
LEKISIKFLFQKNLVKLLNMLHGIITKKEEIKMQKIKGKDVPTTSVRARSQKKHNS